MSTETASYVRLMPGYFSRPDYFVTDVEKGTIRTQTGTRVCALTDDFLRGFRAAVKFECGKATDKVFKKCGRRWGTSFVERFDRDLTDYYGVPVRDVSTGIVEKCLDEAFRVHGWGQLTVDLAEYDAGIVQVIVRNPVLPSVLDGDKPVDALMAGFFASVFSFYANTELECHQTDCPRRGADASRFVVGLPGRLAEVPKMVTDKQPHAVIVRRIKATVTE